MSVASKDHWKGQMRVERTVLVMVEKRDGNRAEELDKTWAAVWVLVRAVMRVQ